ncbi:hypothetical protein L798_07307 [Zootermopsis nevadensis]|uniref:Uncharacterized protein n=1 Tax=Zootermopsis nevadensis TaxID=136037 RepID=A0A067R8H8_ZOONE|nr:hypothetical protein L798_07307 [Zootermopsis nevadensis]
MFLLPRIYSTIPTVYIERLLLSFLQRQALADLLLRLPEPSVQRKRRRRHEDEQRSAGSAPGVSRDAGPYAEDSRLEDSSAGRGVMMPSRLFGRRGKEENESPAFGERGFKRATVGAAGRRAFGTWGGKRAAEFHSWGGKTSSEEQSALAVVSSKRRRPAFNHWGGKRDSASNALADKRDIFGLSVSDEPSLRTWGSNSAPPFSEPSPQKDAVLRSLCNEHPAFSILSSNYEPKPALIALGCKRAFASWGGKREARGPPPSAWGSKGSSDGDARDTRSFLSWGGKRNFIAGGMKEGAEELGKRRFSSWGGKRGTMRTGEIGPGDEGEQSSARISSPEGYRQLLEGFGRKMGLPHEYNEIAEDPEEIEAGENTQRSEPHEEFQQQLGGQSAITKRSEAKARVGKSLFRPWGGKRDHVLPPPPFSPPALGGFRLLSDLFKEEGHARSKTPGSREWGPSPAGEVKDRI